MRSAVATAQELSELVVRRNVTEPLKFAAGVYVTAAGLAVCKILLKEPPPEIIDQAPVVAPPPKLEPAKVIAAGLAD